MRTPEQIEWIREQEEDILDCEKSVKDSEKDLADAKDWLNKQKLYYAEAIIKLNDYLKEHE
jgi:hypothetical protein